MDINKKKCIQIDHATSTEDIYDLYDAVDSDDEEEIDQLTNDSDGAFYMNKETDIASVANTSTAEKKLLIPASNVHQIPVSQMEGKLPSSDVKGNKKTKVWGKGCKPRTRKLSSRSPESELRLDTVSSVKTGNDVTAKEVSGGAGVTPVGIDAATSTDFSPMQETLDESKEHKTSLLSWRNVGVVTVGVAAGGAAVVCVPLALGVLGFTSAGVAAGSVAAGIQSVVYGGAATGLFSVAQSAGAAGLAAGTQAAIGGTVGASASYGIKKLTDYLFKKKPL